MLFHADAIIALQEIHNNTIDSLVTDPPAGISFMGKDWDHNKGGRENWIAWMTDVMRECQRVMKPGAHGFVWAIPRTSHWTATACENAGFEIRDVITHLFGSGFPKSLDISKAIDKAAGAKRDIIGKNPHARPSDGKYDAKYSGVKGHDPNITAPSTDVAKQWSGWGTALKPASEHWILIRKPISEKTVASNVLKWGTGGINVDGCRIGTDQITQHGRNKDNYGFTSAERAGRAWQGRFPANLVLSGDAPEMLDKQSGQVASGGGASRFFYCAKASKSERGEGNNHPTVKPLKLMRYLCRLITPPGGVILDPFIGSGSTGIAAKQEGFKFIGIESDSEYMEIAKRRIAGDAPLFNAQ